MPWNDASFLGANFQVASFVNMFIAAHRERSQILGGFIGTPADLTTGSILQSASLVSTLQNLPVNSYYLWVDPSVDIASITPTINGDHSSDIVYPSLAAVFSAAGLNPAHGFERRRPREIEGITDTVDTQGNAAGSGQRAYLTVPPYGLHRCVSAGTWVRDLALAVRPDLLSNYSAAPNHIIDDVQLDEDGNPFTTGVMLPGDYFGTWIWENIRNVYNQLRWTTSGKLSLIGENDGQFHDSVPTEGEDHSTFAGALAAGHAGYGAVAPFAFTGWPFARAFAAHSSSFGGGPWQVGFQRGTGQFDAAYNDVGLNRQIVFYVAGMDHGDVTETHIYDTNGDTPNVLQGQFTVVDQVTTSAETARSVLMGHLTIPNDPPSPSTEEFASTSRGWQVMTTLSVAKWDVVGGLAYRP
jgi:hypothetical protein